MNDEMIELLAIATRVACTAITVPGLTALQASVKQASDGCWALAARLHGPGYELPIAMTVPTPPSPQMKELSLPGTCTRSPMAMVSSSIS
jgi:hypothetical protein